MTESTSVLPDVLNRSTRLSVFCWNFDIRGNWTFTLEGSTLCPERIGNHNANTQISFPKTDTKPPRRPMIPPAFHSTDRYRQAVSQRLPRDLDRMRTP